MDGGRRHVGRGCVVMVRRRRRWSGGPATLFGGEPHDHTMKRQLDSDAHRSTQPWRPDTRIGRRKGIRVWTAQTGRRDRSSVIIRRTER